MKNLEDTTDDVDKSFLTDAEVQEIQSLRRKTPYMIRGVSTSMFSIARFYGAVVFNGEGYTYNPDTDELVRDDVLKAVMKRRNAKRKRKARPARKDDVPR